MTSNDSLSSDPVPDDRLDEVKQITPPADVTIVGCRTTEPIVAMMQLPASNRRIATQPDWAAQN
nr:hypothetical protein [uncultured Undibacterium sp.]